MYLLNPDKDHILSIVKSLRPIKDLYSKQNKDYDKYFRGSSLKDLIRQMKLKRNSSEFLKPGESLKEITHEKTIMDINFKSTFNYIEELSNLKNLPITLINKPVNQNTRNNKDKKESKKKINTLRINEHQKYRNLLKAKKNWDIDVTLDPGRYHPNYDFIRRRYPCAYLGKPKNEDSFLNNTNNLEENKTSQNNEVNKKEEDNKIYENKEENNYFSQEKIIKNQNKKNQIMNESISNKTFNDKNINNLEPLKKLNFKKSNYFGLYKKNYSRQFNSTSQHKDKFSSNIKDQNTASSWNNTMEFDNSKKLSDHNKSKDKNKSIYNNSNIHFYSTQRGTCSLRKNKKELLKNSSMDNLKFPVIFDKMQGRERPIFVLGTKENSRTSYNPNYNIIRPHIPSFIFKSERRNQEFKKYMTGKIIRSYCCNPEQYFVFEYKDSKENEIYG